MKVLVLHGPNLNLLGERDPTLYGRRTLAELDAALHAHAAGLGLQLRCFQSNHEGALIDRLHEERRWMDALVINPGALGHYAWALRDAIEAVRVRAFEVHLSDVSRREAFRRVSVLDEVVEGKLFGRGLQSYLDALDRLAGPAPARERRAQGPAARPEKTLGRRAARSDATPVPGRPGKTLGARPPPSAPPARPDKTLGRTAPAPVRAGKTLGRSSEEAPARAGKSLGRASEDPPQPAVGHDRRALADRIRDRLAGRTSAAELATWAKQAFVAHAEGPATDDGDHALVEGALLALLQRPGERALIEWVARLDP